MQTALSIALLVAAAGFMFWNFGGKKLYQKASGSKKKDCGSDCNCH